MDAKLHWDEKRPLKEISEALARCGEADMVEHFLQELFTPAETKEMGMRWALVRLLDEGMSQRTIARELGLSLCKITRGSRELKKKDSAFKRMIHL
jgi:TrpR family trp operon transcriptional repressor